MKQVRHVLATACPPVTFARETAIGRPAHSAVARDIRTAQLHTDATVIVEGVRRHGRQECRSAHDENSLCEKANPTIPRGSRLEVKGFFEVRKSIGFKRASLLSLARQVLPEAWSYAARRSFR